jgi:osmotically-inducible protein OsmY
MNWMKAVAVGLIAFVVSIGLGCSNRQQAPDVTSDIRHALDQAGLKDVKVSDVATDADKSRAETIAHSIAGDQVVSNEIGVRPNGDQSSARKVDSDLDSAVDKNLDAMLVQHRLKDNVRYDVKNGVVTLKGNVASEAQRTSVEKLAKDVPNVKEVVNELDVKTRRATSSK